MKISNRIYELRKKSNLSQEELANVLHVSRQAVSKWESEQSTPDIDNVVALSKYFNVTADYLLTGTLVEIKETQQYGILYIHSLALISIGLLVAIFLWYEYQLLPFVGVGLVIQMIGIVLHVIARRSSSIKPSKFILMLSSNLVLWIPISLISNLLFGFQIAPYPITVKSMLLFVFVMCVLNIVLLKYSRKQD